MANAISFSESVQRQAKFIAELGCPAVAGLYDLTSLRLVRFAATITRNQHDAEDAVAASLLKVVSDVELLVRADHAWAFLLQIVRNESLQILRRKKRWLHAATKLSNGLFDLICSSKVDSLDRQEEDREVWKALRELPTEQAEVVVLKIWEDFTFHQIAQTLDIPQATAASRYRYGLEKLSEKLGARFREEIRHG